MSYSICRIAKVKASGVTGIQIHDRREKDGVSHTNEDIDWDKSEQNVDLLEQQEKYRTVVSNRIAELDLKRQPRSDATVMCQCLVTSDNTFFEKMNRQEQNEFFKKSLDFLEERYGKENMVSATIHYDEKTPHMHVNFVPVTSDGRLSARDLFSPKDLRQLQDDYNRNVRENGYDLSRGELHSQKEHLSVEEYKVATKYEELKSKQAELERIETVDKKADLRADKGKITYSTKEVEAIKDQNKALKVELYKKDKQIGELQETVQNVKKRLSKAQMELQATEKPLERLKDLESENRALQTYIKADPDLDKALQPYFRLKDQAYDFGDKMVAFKEYYLRAKDARHNGIELTYSIDRQAKDCDRAISDLSKLQRDINTSTGKCKAYESEIESLKGIFKGKQKKEVQEQLGNEQEVLKGHIERLKDNYNIEPSNIDSKINDLKVKKTNLLKKKEEQISITDMQEQTVNNIIEQYKLADAIVKTQDDDLNEITTRINDRKELPSQDQMILKTSKEDRKEILERMQKEKPASYEKCKRNFEKLEQQEQKALLERQAHKSRSWDINSR